jgi:malic enzyme
MKPVMVDLHEIEEDQRIQMIGKSVGQRLTIGVMLESDEPEKIERYIEKITTRFPTVELKDRRVGYPDASLTMLKFGPKLTSQ